MKPPICSVCGKSGIFDGDSVAFADYVPLPEDVDGHPAGYECFCDQHLEAAKALAHLPSGEAISILRLKFDYPAGGAGGGELRCPQCGKREWDCRSIPGQAEFREGVSHLAGRVAWAGYAALLAAALLYMLPGTQSYALVFLGAAIAIAPAYFVVSRLSRKIGIHMHICKSCGHALTGTEYDEALAHENESATRVGQPRSA